MMSSNARRRDRMNPASLVAELLMVITPKGDGVRTSVLLG